MVFAIANKDNKTSPQFSRDLAIFEDRQAMSHISNFDSNGTKHNTNPIAITVHWLDVIKM